jgi:hypothetical protein
MYAGRRAARVAGITALITAIVLSFGSSSAWSQPKSDGGWGLSRLRHHVARNFCRKRANEQHLRGPVRRAFVRKCIDSLLVGNFPLPPYEGGVFPPTTAPIWSWNSWVAIEGGYSQSNNNLFVDPPFSITGSGGVFGVSGGVSFPVPGANSAWLGPAAGFLLGNMSGTTEHPAASPANIYSANNRYILWQGASFGTHAWSDYYSQPGTSYAPQGFNILGQIGIAEVNTNVSCSCGASDSNVTAGFIFGVGVGIPIANTPLELTAWYHFIDAPASRFNVPGSVAIGSSINMFTGGLQWNFR